MQKILLIIIILLLQSCATVGMVPSNVSEIDFYAPEGKTGWSEYQHVETFHGYNADQIYKAL